MLKRSKETQSYIVHIHEQTREEFRRIHGPHCSCPETTGSLIEDDQSKEEVNDSDEDSIPHNMRRVSSHTH
jgi:hypothetical protein